MFLFPHLNFFGQNPSSFFQSSPTISYWIPIPVEDALPVISSPNASSQHLIKPRQFCS
jgi:hypothetical protein